MVSILRRQKLINSVKEVSTKQIPYGNLGFSLFLGGVPIEEIDNCLLWAFGERFSILPLRQIDERWNELHGDLFLLAGCDLMDESLRRIGKAYMKEVIIE